MLSGENGFQNTAYGLTYKKYKDYLSNNDNYTSRKIIEAQN